LFISNRFFAFRHIFNHQNHALVVTCMVTVKSITRGDQNWF